MSNLPLICLCIFLGLVQLMLAVMNNDKKRYRIAFIQAIVGLFAYSAGIYSLAQTLTLKGLGL